MTERFVEQAQANMGAIERLLKGLPGIRGYVDKELRRDADKRLRDAIAGQLTEQKRWERATLAAQARNYPLANSLISGLTTLAPRGKLLVDVAQKPEMLDQPSRFSPADEPMSDVVSLGLRRLARQDPEKAMALLDGYASTMHFSRDEKVAIAREIGLTQDWPVVVVGIGNLGHALANYSGFSSRGFRTVALLDAERGEQVLVDLDPDDVRRRPVRGVDPRPLTAVGPIDPGVKLAVAVGREPDRGADPHRIALGARAVRHRFDRRRRDSGATSRSDCRAARCRRSSWARWRSRCRPSAQRHPRK